MSANLAPPTTSTTLQDAYRYCEDIARTRARNFYPAFRFLSLPRRQALSAFYAFCALSDDIADDTSTPLLADRLQRLERWQLALDECLQGQAQEAVFVALADAAQRYQFTRQPFLDLLEGMRMDFAPRRYTTFTELELYCRRVASSVGRVALRIFGCTSTGADRYADQLGIAFQLTNILRDLGEDISRQRLYLPLEDLDRFHYTEDDLRQRIYDQRFFALMTFQYQRAWGYFRATSPVLAGQEAARLFPAQIMKAVYWRTLHELKRRQFHVLDGRISIPWWRKASAVTLASLQQLTFLF